VKTTPVALAVLLVSACGACRDSTTGIRTEFVGSYAFSATDRRTIARVAGLAARDARQHLPALASELTLQVRSGKDVIPELGASAVAGLQDWVQWTVDPDRPEGVVKIAETHLRGALFHEFHHLVRGSTIVSTTLMDHVVTEGMATAFERDFAGESRPWADYPGDVSKWVDQLLLQPPTADRSEWLSRHPDGRRWIGFKAGTYLVDQAMKRLNRSSAELVAAPTAEILAAASDNHKMTPRRRR
jgi:uncharacterized protein YjaZ